MSRALAGESTAVRNGPSPKPSPLVERRGVWRDALRRRLLACSDVACVSLVLVVVSVSFGRGFAHLFWSIALVPLWVLLAKLYGLYDRDHRTLRHLTADELPSLITWATTGTAILAGALSLTPVGAPRARVAVALWLGIVVLVPIARSAVRGLWRMLTVPERLVIVGAGPLETATRRKLDLFQDIHVQVSGSLDDAALCGAMDEGRLESGLRSASGDGHIDRLVLASSSIDERLIAALVSCCRRCNWKLTVVPPARGMFGTAVQLNHVADLPMVEYNTWDIPRSTVLLKRIIDVVLAGLALLVLSPLLVVLAVAVRCSSRGPSVFRQRRAGLHGKPFTVYKFRTMVADAERRLEAVVDLHLLADPMFKLRADPRITRIGRPLRRMSLDELPQLLNVFMGHMSLVGPRPEQLDLVERYRPEHRFRLTVKPGLTGPMQVFGRGELNFDERLAVEREYVENLSLGRDVRIVLLTASVVLRGRGAY